MPYTPAIDASALQEVQCTSAEQHEIPLHLRNAQQQDRPKRAGFGKGYRYAHDDPDAVDEMECLPPGLADRKYIEGE